MARDRKENKNDIRSARMRERVLTETLDCIFEIGLRNASTVEIAKRVGVSRGAMVHHFPSKEALICAAFEHLLLKELDLFRDVLGSYADGDLSLDGFVDFLWSRFSGRHFMIILDYIALARTNKVMRDQIDVLRVDHQESLNAIWSRFFANEGVSEERAQIVLNLTLCLMRGMAVQHVVRKDKAYFDSLQDYWKSHLKMLLTDPVKSKRG